MTVCSQERPFGVLNYAPSHLMDSTKGASLIPGIGFATINTILLLYFILFYLLFSGCFAIFNYYVILMEYVKYFFISLFS